MKIKYDYKNLRKALSESSEDIFSRYDNILTDDVRFIYKNNNAPVLAVCHLDTVQPLKQEKEIIINEKTITTTGLDDRLGYFICEYFLPTLPHIKLDYLYTDNEEIGKSTAKYLSIANKYNWIVEFDRKGEDVVTYNKDNPKFLKCLKKYFKKIGVGSFSDISVLKTESCCFNMGIGYEKAHAVDSFADLKTLARQLVRFMYFYNRFSNTKFVIEKRPDPIVTYYPVKKYNNFNFNNRYNSNYNINNNKIIDSNTNQNKTVEQMGIDFDMYCDCCFQTKYAKYRSEMQGFICDTCYFTYYQFSY